MLVCPRKNQLILGGAVPTPKTVVPALGDNSFTCPHCGAVSHQTWYKAFLTRYDKDDKPWIPAPDTIEWIKTDRELTDKESLIAFFEKKLTKQLFHEVRDNNVYLRTELVNLNISR